MAYHSSYGAHGAWGTVRGAGGARPDRPEQGRRRGSLTLRDWGSRDRCLGRRVSFGFLPSAT